MQEIIVNGNATGLRIVINGVPNLKLISKDEAENTAIALELQISEFHKKEQSIERFKISTVK